MHYSEYETDRLLEVAELVGAAIKFHRKTKNDGFHSPDISQYFLSGERLRNHLQILMSPDNDFFKDWGRSIVGAFLGHNLYFGYTAVNNQEIIVALRGSQSFVDLGLCFQDGWEGHNRNIIQVLWTFGKSVFKQIISTVRNHPEKRIILAGHSLGAAVACVVAYLLEKEIDKGDLEDRDIITYSFGAPTIGKGAPTISKPLVSIWTCEDIIPHFFNVVVPELCRDFPDLEVPEEICESFSDYRHMDSYDITSIVLTSDNRVKDYSYYIDSDDIIDEASEGFEELTKEIEDRLNCYPGDPDLSDLFQACLEPFKGLISRHTFVDCYLKRLKAAAEDSYW